MWWMDQLHLLCGKCQWKTYPKKGFELSESSVFDDDDMTFDIT